jgi:UDP-2,3-diacylglucosamine pyrophosphatase LpxH
MRLPIIKALVESDLDEDYFLEAVESLLVIAEARGIKDEELNVIGELISNLEGAQTVLKEIKQNNTPVREALNSFMKRVQNSIL